MIRSRAYGKELEYSWHILLESVCVCVCVWLGGSVWEGKGWPEAANSTEGLLAISLLDFWTWLSWYGHDMDMSLGKLWETVKDREVWRAAVHRVAESDMTYSDWTTTVLIWDPLDHWVNSASFSFLRLAVIQLWATKAGNPGLQDPTSRSLPVPSGGAGLPPLL